MRTIFLAEQLPAANIPPMNFTQRQASKLRSLDLPDGRCILIRQPIQPKSRWRVVREQKFESALLTDTHMDFIDSRGVANVIAFQANLRRP